MHPKSTETQPAYLHEALPRKLAQRTKVMIIHIPVELHV